MGEVLKDVFLSAHPRGSMKLSMAIRDLDEHAMVKMWFHVQTEEQWMRLDGLFVWLSLTLNLNNQFRLDESQGDSTKTTRKWSLIKWLTFHVTEFQFHLIKVEKHSEIIEGNLNFPAFSCFASGGPFKRSRGSRNVNEGLDGPSG